MLSPNETRIQWYKDFLKEFEEQIWPVFSGRGICKSDAFVGFCTLEATGQSEYPEEYEEEEQWKAH